MLTLRLRLVNNIYYYWQNKYINRITHLSQATIFHYIIYICGMKTLFAIISLCLIPRITLTAQSNFVDKLVYKESKTHFLFVSELGKDGVIACTENKRDDIYTFNLYDTLLQLKKTVSFQNKEQLNLSGYTETENRICLLFTNENFIDGNMPVKYKVVSLDATTLILNQQSGTSGSIGLSGSMALTKDYLLIGSYLMESQGLSCINLNTGEFKFVEIPIYYAIGSRPIITKLVALPNHTAVAFLELKKYRKQFALNALQIDNEGNIIHYNQLNPVSGEQLLTYSAELMSDSSIVFTGTYSRANNLGGEGIFFCRIKGEVIQNFTLTKYVAFDKFYSYTEPSKQPLVEMQVTIRDTSAQTIIYDYRINPVGVQFINGMYYLLAEAYYPLFKDNKEDFYNKYFLYDNAIPEGYYYSHNLLIGFDNFGRKTWDINSSIAPNELTRMHDPISAFEISPSGIHVWFLANDMIQDHFYELNGDLANVENFDPYNNDKTLAEIAKLNTVHWYGNNFLVYALKEVSDPDKPSKFTDALLLRKVSY